MAIDQAADQGGRVMVLPEYWNRPLGADDPELYADVDGQKKPSAATVDIDLALVDKVRSTFTFENDQRNDLY